MGLIRGLRIPAAALSVVVACAAVASMGPVTPQRNDVAGTPVHGVLATAFDTAVLGELPVAAAVSGPAVGPYAATEAGLVDVDCRLRGGTASGTGIVVSSDGLVVTNNHVVASAISISAVDLGNGRRYPAAVLVQNPGRDVAVIRLVGAAGLAVAPLGDSDQVRVGDQVTALGNAGGRGGPPTVTIGAVIALDRSIDSVDEHTQKSHRLRGVIEVSASVPQGDSGGALLSASGVVGMNAAAGPHSGFAIPINTVLAIARGSDTGAVPMGAHRNLAVDN